MPKHTKLHVPETPPALHELVLVTSSGSGHALDPNGEDTAYYQSIASNPPSRRLVVLRFPKETNQTIEWRGETIIGNDAVAADAQEKYLLFVGNEQEEEVSLVKSYTSQVIRLVPCLKEPPVVVVPVASTSASAAAVREKNGRGEQQDVGSMVRDLVENFGSKRKRLSVKMQEEGRVVGSHVASVLSIDANLEKERVRREEREKKQEESEESEDVRPVRNVEAKDVSEAYSREDYFPEHVYMTDEYCRADLDALLFPETIASSSSTKTTTTTATTSLRHAGEFGTYFITKHKTLLKRITLGESDMQEKARNLVYFGTLLRFFNACRRVGRNVSEDDVLQSVLGASWNRALLKDAPPSARDVARSLLERFTKVSGPENRVQDKLLRDKLLMVILVVAMSMYDYELDKEVQLGHLCRDLEIRQEQISPYLWRLGARPMKTQEQQGTSYVMKLEYTRDGNDDNGKSQYRRKRKAA